MISRKPEQLSESGRESAARNGSSVLRVSYDERLNHILEEATGLMAHVGYFAANMAALKVCSHELDSPAGKAYEEANHLRRDYYDLTRLIVDRVFDAHAPQSTLDRHVATMSLFGMLNWLYRWYAPKRGCSPTTVANQIASQFLNGVLEVSSREA